MRSKMLYYREGESSKHLRDIAAMCRVSGAAFDVDYLQSWIERLGLTGVWNAIQEGMTSRDNSSS